MKLKRSILLVFIATIMLFVSSCISGNYKVAFDTDGGSTIENQYIELNHHVKEPVEPTKEGYTFVGWYLNDELYDFNTLVDRNFVLVAKWEEVVIEYVNVTFIVNGEEVASYNIEKGTSVNRPTDPVLEGKYFAGWYIGDVQYDFSQAVNENTTVEAKFEDAVTMEMVAGNYEGIESMSGMELASYKLSINADGTGSMVCISSGYELPMEVKGVSIVNNRVEFMYNNGADSVISFAYVDGALVSTKGIMGGEYTTITLNVVKLTLADVVGTWEGVESYSGMDIPYTLVVKEDGTVEASIDMFGYVTPLTFVSFDGKLVLDYMGMNLEFNYDGTSFSGVGAMGSSVVLNKKEEVKVELSLEALAGSWEGTEVTPYGDYSYTVKFNADGTGSGKYVDSEGLYPTDLVITKTEIIDGKAVVTYLSYGMEYTMEFTYSDGALKSSQGAMWGELTLNKTISLSDVEGTWVASESFYGMDFDYKYVINADGTGSAEYTSSAMTTVMTVISYSVVDGKIILDYQVDGMSYEALVFTYVDGVLSGTTPMGTTVTYSKALSVSDLAGEWEGTEVTSYGDYSYTITLNNDGTGTGKYVDSEGLYPSDLVISKTEISGDKVVLTYLSYGMEYTMEFTYSDGALSTSQGAMWGSLTLNRK